MIAKYFNKFQKTKYILLKLFIFASKFSSLKKLEWGMIQKKMSCAEIFEDEPAFICKTTKEKISVTSW